MRIKSIVQRAFLAAGYEIHRRGTWLPRALPPAPPPADFYSPIVDLNELEKDKARIFDTNREVFDIDFNEGGQLGLVEEFAKLYQDIPFEDSQGDANLYYYDNPYYGYGDAIILACMLRHVKPKRLIEFGSGFSSCVTLDINRLFLSDTVKCTFIDPNPERLESLVSKHNDLVTILKSRAQDIDLETILAFEPNDIVFIDSTHVAKAGSDVNFLLFEVLPRLRPGVLVHFHDIFYPFEYPEDWFFELNRSWNENYMLRAYLTANTSYQIVFFNDYMRLRHFDVIVNAMPLFQKNSGGALWIRKVR
jgi:hypothetical protein